MKNRLLLVLLSCFALCSCLESSKKELNHAVLDNLSDSDRILFKKYYSLGKGLYYAKCQNCHGEDGKGLGKLIPPLAAADFMVTHENRLPCIIKFGISGPLQVNGTSYEQLMPGNKALRPLEIAELLTYIGSSCGNNLGLTRIKQVNHSLSDCE